MTKKKKFRDILGKFHKNTTTIATLRELKIWLVVVHLAIGSPFQLDSILFRPQPRKSAN